MFQAHARAVPNSNVLTRCSKPRKDLGYGELEDLPCVLSHVVATPGDTFLDIGSGEFYEL